MKFYCTASLTMSLALTLVAYGDQSTGPVAKITKAFLADPDAPELNKKVVQYCEDHLGQKVMRGECAELAISALRAAGARTFPPHGVGADYVWGQLVGEIKPKSFPKVKVLPGDLLQFRDAQFKGPVPGGYYSKSAPHHTSIVVAVVGKTVHVLEQNVGSGKVSEVERRKVQPGSYVFEDLVDGRVRIFRPTSEPLSE